MDYFVPNAGFQFPLAAKRKMFEQKRKMHYNEFHAVKLARQLIDDDDEEDEEEKEEEKDTDSSKSESSSKWKFMNLLVWTIQIYMYVLANTTLPVKCLCLTEEKVFCSISFFPLCNQPFHCINFLFNSKSLVSIPVQLSTSFGEGRNKSAFTERAVYI